MDKSLPIVLRGQENAVVKASYHISVYTGNRSSAGTTANVYIVLGGIDDESDPIRLRIEERPLFKRGMCLRYNSMI